MRSLLAALIALLWVLDAPAQERRGRVVLEDGRTFEGVVLHLDQERIQLDVEGRRMTFRVLHIAKYEPLTPAAEPVPDPVADPEADPAAGEEAADGPAGTAPVPDSRPQQPPAAPLAETASRPKVAPHASMLARRLGVLEERYPWIQPRGLLQWASIGLLVLLYLSLAMQLSSRFANAENRELPKAVLAAILTGLAAVVQLATVPFDGLTLSVLLVGNALVWLLLTRLLYGLGFFASCTMFFCAMMVCAVGFLVLEVVDYTLQSIQGGPAG